MLHDGVDAAGGVEEHGGEGVVEENNVYPPAPELLPPALSEHYSPTVAGKADAKKPVAKKKRICKFPGCTKTVKAQGHCQRHGAKTKRCKVPDCTSQAQGSHDGTFDKSFAYYIMVSNYFLCLLYIKLYNIYTYSFLLFEI